MSSTGTIETIYNKNRTRRVRIEYDDDGSACDPREYDELVEIVTPDTSMTEHTDGAMFEEAHRRLYYKGLGGAFARYLKIFHDVNALPVYKYEHSGVALSTGSFIGRAQHAEWDSGMIGWAYIRPDAEHWDGMDEEAILSGFVEELGKWMNGEVYGWIVEKQVSYVKSHLGAGGEVVDNETGAEWVEEDACWGFVGYDYAQEAAKEALGEDNDGAV
jgi:hypothetical protein